MHFNNYVKYIIGTLLFSCFIVTNTFSQQYYFEQYTTEDGLASTQVRAIYQDDFGYLWVGTAIGLNRFDGKTFENFSSSRHIVDAQVNEILGKKNGGIWVVTTRGVSIINGNHTKLIDLTSHLDGNNIYDAAEDSEGNLWCLIYKKGLLKISAKNFEIEQVSYNRKYTELSINNDVLYLSGAGNEVERFDINSKNSESIQLPENGIPSRQAEHFSSDTLIVTDLNQVHFMINGRIQPFYFENHIGGARDIFVDRQKNIWIASKSGVRRISKSGNQIRLHMENGMPFESSRVVYEDKDDNIWVGTDGGGLLRFFPNQEFTTYTLSDGLPSEQVMSIVETSNKMWFSTYSDGVFSYDGTSYEHFTNNNGLPNNTVWSSVVGSDGKIWFGTSQGLSCFYNNQIKNYTKKDGLSSDRITAVFFDNKKRLWAGSKSALSLLVGDSIKTFSKADGFEGYRVRIIKQDHEGIVWIGCKNGLFSFSNDGFQVNVWSDSLSYNNQIYSMELVEGNVLLGTSSGIYSYNKKSREAIKLSVEKQEISIPTYFIKREGNDTFWAGSGDGIRQFIYKKSGKRINIVSEVKYSRKNGISNLETNQNSAYIDKKGQLWFGTGKGLVQRINVKTKQNKIVKPLPIKINTVKLFLEDLADSIILQTAYSKFNHRQNHLTFDFKSIYLENPKQILYQFKLDGFDQDWLPPTKNGSFTYSNLSYGNYKFSVRSSIDAENWSVPAEYQFTILPPFWLTKWFLMLAGIIFMALVYIIYKWRTNVNQRKRSAERLEYKNKLLSLEQQSLSSSMNRHFIFNALNSIQYYINTQDRLSANKYLSSFAKLIRKNLESSGNKNNVIPLKEELDRVDLYLELENMRFQDKIKYSIKVAPGVNTEEIMLPPMFFQPFIENSIWHGILPKDGGEVKINITKEGNKKVRINIEDDGVGISTSQANKNTKSHNSRGVILTKRRIQLLEKALNKRIEVVGPEEMFDHKNNTKGTRVDIILPVDKVT